MEMIDDEPDLSIYDFNSIINYIKNNYVQFLLLILVFLIIYTVDYISNMNAMIMAPVSMIQKQHPIKIPKPHKRSKK
jgi:hypothetical protein